MSDSVVSIRLPKTMVKELEVLMKKNHYLDMSEQIRNVIREKSLKKLNEYYISESKREENQERDTKIEELQKLLQELKNV